MLSCTEASVLVTPISAPAEPVALALAVSPLSGVFAITDSEPAVMCTEPECELLGSPSEATTVGLTVTSVFDTPTASPPAATPNMSASAVIVLLAVTLTAPLACTIAFGPM